MKLSTKLRVVLDSNVFVSAFVWGGNPEKVLQFWASDRFTLFISPEILLEILTVLERFQVQRELILEIKNLIEDYAEKIIPRSKFNICRDSKDNKFLNLCLDCQADYFITGDKDLLILKKFEKTKIEKPKDFLRALKR